MPNDLKNDADNLASYIYPPSNEILETEGVDRLGKETEEREIEVLDSETKELDSDNEGVDKKVLNPDNKCYILRNPSNVKYSDKRSTQRSMGWNNLIVCSNELHSVAKVFVNVVNAIANCFKPISPTNIITNKTILT